MKVTQTHRDHATAAPSGCSGPCVAREYFNADGGDILDAEATPRGRGNNQSAHADHNRAKDLNPAAESGSLDRGANLVDGYPEVASL